jgi:hypothetical protein
MVGRNGLRREGLPAGEEAHETAGVVGGRGVIESRYGIS